jgi:hypothetical protein
VIGKARSRLFRNMHSEQIHILFVEKKNRCILNRYIIAERARRVQKKIWSRAYETLAGDAKPCPLRHV